FACLYDVLTVKCLISFFAGVPQMEWLALSLDLNPIENLLDQLSRRLEGCNPAPQNLNDLRAALQEEWNAFMRHHYQAVIDEQGHMKCY
uniref:Uncharacterized protein n=1 Tax=Mola mola TaxID=94237 RepID=A0A3Q4AX67_MOLML